jgi:hypothetical protein
MPLILAIVADPQVAAQLAASIQGRLSVDLVQAAEVGEGLLALDNRIPDLILTSPLMSPFDDGVLDEYLRDLGPAGTHVQTLRIPVLSQASKKKPRLGFSLRRRSKPETPAIEGCDPKVFADEIEQYLARAAEEKRHASAHEPSAVIAEGSPDDLAAPADGDVEWTPAYSFDAPTANVAWSAPKVEAESVAWRADLLDTPPAQDAEYPTPIYQAAPLESIAEPVEPEPRSEMMEVASTPAAVESIEEPAVEKPAPVADVAVIEPAAVEEITEAAARESAIVETVSAEPGVVESVTVAVAEPVTAAAAFVEPKGTPEPAARPTAAATEADSQKATPSFKAALAAIRAAWGQPSSPKAAPRPSTRSESPTTSEPKARRDATLGERKTALPAADAPAPLEVDLTGAVELLDEQPVELPHQAPAREPLAVLANASEEVSDVYELSVEPDMQELESQLLTPLAPKPTRGTGQVPASPTPPVSESRKLESRPAAEPKGHRRSKSKRENQPAAKTKGQRSVPQAQEQPQPPRAAQDEWGVFDPDRCGFAALVDKLDKVSDEKPEQPRNGNKGRVISYS